MKENEIIKLALKKLEKQGKIPWVSYKRTGFAQQDIFGIFDIVYLQNDKTTLGDTFAGFIQVTTRHHISDRRKKIYSFFTRAGILVPPRCYIWAYDRTTGGFTEERL